MIYKIPVARESVKTLVSPLLAKGKSVWSSVCASATTTVSALEVLVRDVAGRSIANSRFDIDFIHECCVGSGTAEGSGIENTKTKSKSKSTKGKKSRSKSEGIIVVVSMYNNTILCECFPIM